jgi:hypothetical protein
MRYDAKMLGSDIYNAYGATQLEPRAQYLYLRYGGHEELAEDLRAGLITVEESARLMDDTQLEEDLHAIELRHGHKGVLSHE